MSFAATLPPKLHNRLHILEKKIRKLRAIQGGIRLILLLVCTAFLAIAADGYFGMPSWLRCVALAAWLSLGLFAARRWLILPLTAPIDSAALAAAIEEQYPRLNERLTTAVELSQSEEINGSPEFADEIIHDVAARSRKLDFDVSLPTRDVFWFAGISCIALFVILSPLFVVQGSSEKLRRFFTPWHQTAVELNYRIVITSGDPGVKKGDSVTLTGFLEPTSNGAVLPKGATLAIKQPGGEMQKLPMLNEQENVYHLKRNGVVSNFEYRIEAGEVQSEWHLVRAVEPVSLVSAVMRVRPPEYIAKDEERMEGLVEINAWQFSKVTFDLQLDRTPVLAYVEWAPEKKEPQNDGPDKSGSAAVQKLKLNVDESLRATLSVTAKESGSFKLVLEGDQKVRNEFSAQPLQVRVDTPPRFQQVTGLSERDRDLKPGEKVNLKAIVLDDLAVDQLELEYRVNVGDIKKFPLTIAGKGTPQLTGNCTLDFLKPLKEGDRVEYRLVATDNRQLPELMLEAQKTYFPAEDKWASLVVKKDAQSLTEQEILARKKEINDRLDKLIDDLKSEQRAAYKLKMESGKQPLLDNPQAERLGALREEVRDTSNKLERLSKDVEVSPEMGLMSSAIKAVADGETRDAETALNQSQLEKQQEPRTKQLDSAEGNLAKAIEKLQDLKKQTDKLAQTRLEQMKLEEVADEQKNLADKAAATDPNQLKELAQKQKELEDQFQKLVEKEDDLRKALADANADEARDIAEELKQLAQKERDLAQAMKRAEMQNLQQRLADLVKKQQDLLEKAERLQKKTDNATRAAQAPSLDTNAAKDARTQLEKGDLSEALKNQEQAALALDRLAADLERAIAKASDPREAAKQLARWQQNLQRRLEDALAKSPDKKLTAEQQKAMKDEQELLQKLVEKLPLPADGTGKQQRDEAARAARDAADTLQNGKADNAEIPMLQAKAALDKLSEVLPSLDKRLAQSKAELAQLKQQQETLSKQAEQVLKSMEKADPSAEATRKDLAQKLADLVKKEEQLAEKIAKLDTPTKEARRDKAAEAARNAARDMQEPRAADIPASQGAIKRELDRLEQALGGQQTAEEKADELAKRQKELAKQFDAAAKDTSKAKGLAQKQLELNREVEKLPATEAPARHAEAVEAGKKLEADNDNNAKPEEIARDARDAAGKLEKLADAINRRETDADRADALAKKQAKQAEDFDKLAKKNATPAQQAEAKKKSQQLQEELKQIPGEEFQNEKQKALQSLDKAQQGNPAQMAKAQQQAADSLKEFADKLKREEAKKDLTAEQLARKERELAKETQAELEKADKLPKDEAAKAKEEALQKAAEAQAELNRNAEALKQPEAAKAKEALGEAQKSLAEKDAQKSGEKMQQAAEALEKLARDNKEGKTNQPEQLPNRNDTEAAKELAKEQRQLQQDLIKARDDLARGEEKPKGNPVGDLAKEQAELAEAAKELAEKTAKAEGPMAESSKRADGAAQAAKQSAEQLKNGDVGAAQQAGQTSASKLEQLAQNSGDKEMGKKASELAAKQEELNKKMGQMEGNSGARKAQQEARQKELEGQAEKLGDRLEKLMQQQSADSKSREPGQKAEAGVKAAREQMQQARENSMKNKPDAASQAREKAGMELDGAAEKAMEAADRMTPGKGDGKGSPLGQSLRQARDAMENAKEQLGKGNKPGAQSSMQQAQDKLGDAGKQLEKQANPNPGKPGSNPNGSTPGGNRGDLNGTPDLKQFGPEAAKYEGKPWGELPGELKTKIIQDLKTRYGEDYARNIKLYFESLAERK